MALIGKMIDKLLKQGSITLVQPSGERSIHGPGGGRSLTIRIADRLVSFEILKQFAWWQWFVVAAVFALGWRMGSQHQVEQTRRFEVDLFSRFEQEQPDAYRTWRRWFVEQCARPKGQKRMPS